MTRLYQILIFLLSLFLLSWILPWILRIAMPEYNSVPFTLYSEVVHEFASLEPDGQKSIRYFDHAGRTYTEEQFDSILPSFYYRQLLMDNRMPDTLEGRSVDVEELRRAGFIFRSRPSEVNKRIVPLYPLLESVPKRVDLEMPDDVLRFTDEGVVFIEMASNSIRPSKSELFTKVMIQKGVIFPIRYIAGNPTNRKDYDEGYFFVDDKEQLFHLKQVRGRPFVRPIPLPEGLRVAQVFVTEYPSRSFFAFLSDMNGHFYMIERPDYRLRQLDLPPTDLSKQEMTIIGNPYYWTVVRDTEAGRHYTAIDARTLEAVDTLLFADQTTKAQMIAKYLFSFQTSFISADNLVFKPQIHHFSFLALLPDFALALLYALIRRQKMPTKELIGKSTLIFISGLFGFIPLLLLDSKVRVNP